MVEMMRSANIWRMVWALGCLAVAGTLFGTVIADWAISGRPTAITFAARVVIGVLFHVVALQVWATTQWSKALGQSTLAASL